MGRRNATVRSAKQAEEAARRQAARDRVFGPPTEEMIRFRKDPGIIVFDEVWWRDHYYWLLESGYMLRSRYHPDWTSPWPEGDPDWSTYEEAQRPPRLDIMDATRTADGAYVVLKRIRVEPYGSRELEITQYLSSEPLASDPRNHSVRLLETLQAPKDPALHILVLPLLRPFDDPEFETFGEIIAFFSQMFEVLLNFIRLVSVDYSRTILYSQGLQFLHEHGVAHRDCTRLNIMMNADNLYLDQWHPPVKYYFIDYGLSTQHKPGEIPLEFPVHGADKTVPENQDQSNNFESRCNPFPTDIYTLGNLIRRYFMKKYYGFGFMDTLVVDMVENDPSKRPQIDEVVDRFAKIRDSFPIWRLRNRPIPRKEFMVVTLWKESAHLARTILLLIDHKSAIPDLP
ncbi:hypothetical protein EVG20_g8277 [Dentipellis fragilis]|uniref:Protein kinase domain-containing protein n=1 Tax=Dentipellis fragilis TaxID=205917 RepID=A0A4Y9Y894_9AGAM|nr:hypothetical protein EVG20_g8277 [Dentipellis fragilis]